MGYYARRGGFFYLAVQADDAFFEQAGEDVVLLSEGVSSGIGGVFVGWFGGEGYMCASRLPVKSAGRVVEVRNLRGTYYCFCYEGHW